MDLNSESGLDVVKSAPEQDEAKEGQVVYADLSQPFERPAEEFVPGPFYKAVEEIIPELDEDKSAAKGLDEGLSVDRRDFMRLFSASALLGAAACVRRPEEKAVPYVNQPTDYVVGQPVYYATTCGECSAGCGVVVKTKEGRPAKIEGNPEHPISLGATCALGQSALQALYHPERRKKALVELRGNMEASEWDEAFERLGTRLASAKNVAILTNGSTGHRHRFFETFLEHVGAPKTNLYTYDANGLLAATSKAYDMAFGAPGMPRYDLRAASLVVGIGSDFLDVGISPVHMTKTYMASHTFRMGRMGKFIQFESTLSNTGAKAHERFVIPVGSEAVVGLLLVRSLKKNDKSKGSSAERAEIDRVLEQNKGVIDSAMIDLGLTEADIARVADELFAQEKAVVMVGSTATDANATTLQLVGIMANILIGAFGSTVFFENAWFNAPVRAGDMNRFLADANKIDLLFIIDTNPVFTLPASFGIAEKLKAIGTVVSIQSQNTETDAYAQFVFPGRHYLESWGDEETVAGFWSLRQPTVRPTTDSRQAEDILIWTCAGANKPMKVKEYRDFLLDRWKAIYSLVKPSADISFDRFFKAVLRSGFVGKLEKRTLRPFAGVADKIKIVLPEKGLKLVSPLDIRLRDGVGADRPLLQEAGDSLTSIAWDTWVAVNPHTAKKLGFKRNDLLRLETSAGSVEAALYPLPGLHPEAVVIHRGNGRVKGVNRVTDGYGVNPSPLFSAKTDALSGTPVFSSDAVKLSAVGKVYELAAMQKHNDIANRSDIVKKMTVAEAAVAMAKAKDLDTVPDLYPKLKQNENYRWGMAIDLTACTGCMACTAACHTENNVAMVGRQQVLKGREMHWIRIDRYFAGPVDNPEVTFQPMLCQHCNHAPCEAVCPVFATTHSDEGVNQQTYNRCVGTRYCANACPYKIRRFNWFTHKWNVVGEREQDRNLRALNPDVTVRTRGIMEKCSFCVQRIRDVKHRAKERGDIARDGEIRTACQQVCPSNAIVFGNLKDERSMVARLRVDGRAYLALNGDPEHGHYGLKTQPNVSYLAEITHKPSVINQGKHESKEHGNEEHKTTTEEHG